MEHSCADSVPVEGNPGVWLGGVMGLLATQGRNKVTLIASPKVSTFGYWVEQLIAESTGKEGKGIVRSEERRVGKECRYRVWTDESKKNKIHITRMTTLT